MAWSASSDLDRGHAHRRGGLEVDAEVVEEHALGGLDGEQLAGDLVEARFGLAHADLARLDDLIEARHHVGDVGARVAADHVVGETRGERSRPASPRSSATTISGRTSPDSNASTSAPATRWPSASDSVANRVSNSTGADRRCARGAPTRCRADSVAFTDRRNESGRLVRALVSGERFEGAGENHAAEIPEYRSDHDRRAYDGWQRTPPGLASTSPTLVEAESGVDILGPALHQEREK